jgi:hypothetical protein
VSDAVGLTIAFVALRSSGSVLSDTSSVAKGVARPAPGGARKLASMSRARRYLRGLADADHRAGRGGDLLDLARGLGSVWDGGKLGLDDRCVLGGWLLVGGRL